MAAELHNLSTRKNIGKAKALLHALVPRAQCFCLYSMDRECVWSSDGAEDYEIDGFIEDLTMAVICAPDSEAQFLRRSMQSGRTVFAMPVLSDPATCHGVLVAVFSKNAGKSAGFNPALLHGILQPAVELIADGLDTEAELKTAASESSRLSNELKLVYQVDETVHGSSRSHAGLANLVGQSGRFLEIAYSVLLVPGKRIRISATHSSWKGVNRKVLDRYLVDHMLPKLAGRNYPVVFEIPALDEPADDDGTQAGGYQTLLSPVTDGQGQVEGVLAQLGRVNQRPFDDHHRRFMAHVARKVEFVIERSFDTMTGLVNRSGFEAQLKESLKSLEDGQAPHQLIYFDLDNMQLVNDKFGRGAGDQVIRRFARILEDNLPRSAVASRLAGDEFCILLTESSTDQAAALAAGIRGRSDQLRYLQGDSSLQVTMSAGVSEFNRDNGRDSNALTLAKMACDAAKEHGGDRVEIYDDQNLSMVRRYDDMNLVAEIQKALDNDGFVLMAQPIVKLSDDDGSNRYEILLRMPSEEGDAVPTDSFLSAAERYQLMPQIDRWVVSNTLRALSDNLDVLSERDALFAINLSGQSLSDGEMLEFVKQEIDDSGVPHSMIGFEITESAAVSNLRRAQHIISTLHEDGCRISLDDFGAGLSSFAYLKQFNVDALKIDGSFIRDITDNRISESMVAAISQVATVMELDTIAEYVESDEIRELIVKLGVDFAQGHGVCAPMTLEDIIEDLTRDERSWLA